MFEVEVRVAQLIGCDLVNDDIALLLDVLQQVSDCGGVEGLARLLNQPLNCLLFLLRRRRWPKAS